jgi:hypothetical protein
MPLPTALLFSKNIEYLYPHKKDKVLTYSALLSLLSICFFAIFGHPIKATILAPLVIVALVAVAYNVISTLFVFFSVGNRARAVNASDTTITFTTLHSPSPFPSSSVSHLRSHSHSVFLSLTQSVQNVSIPTS